MPKKQTDPIMLKLNAECLKRSKHGACRMECEAFKSKMGYCRSVWKTIGK